MQLKTGSIRRNLSQMVKIELVNGSSLFEYSIKDELGINTVFSCKTASSFQKFRF